MCCSQNLGHHLPGLKSCTSHVTHVRSRTWEKALLSGTAPGNACLGHNTRLWTKKMLPRSTWEQGSKNDCHALVGGKEDVPVFPGQLLGMVLVYKAQYDEAQILKRTYLPQYLWTGMFYLWKIVLSILVIAFLLSLSRLLSLFFLWWPIFGQLK